MPSKTPQPWLVSDSPYATPPFRLPHFMIRPHLPVFRVRVAFPVCKSWRRCNMQKCAIFPSGNSYLPRSSSSPRLRCHATMPCSNVGDSTLRVSRMCFGTMMLGERNSYEESCALLSGAVDAGINFFDTAEMYPVPQQARTHGRSEEYLGRWMAACGRRREDLVVATKVAGPSGEMVWIRDGPPSLDAKNITAAVEGSLRRLQTEYIDLYQVHWPDRYVPMFGDTDFEQSRSFQFVSFEEQLEALSAAVTAGKIRHVGVSNETPWGLCQWLNLQSNRRNLPKIISIQNAYSLLCRTFDSGLSECCFHHNVGLLAYSPLAMGLLSGKYHSPGGTSAHARLNKYRGRYAEAEGRYPVQNSRVKEAVLRYEEISRRHGIESLTVLALAFVLRHPLVSSVVFGAVDRGQLEEAVRAVDVVLTDDLISEIDGVHQNIPNPTP
eukprot:TRINITY_DN10984_c0_g2_i2.p1 TRINITY_DN10984_c0_g2~~TRINITY_DN10984_c0_g2_i2.p1  ORF type:complete len:437 (-),score=18.40 TRINITY_DN10984_c0_g2_i2:145-1455(-)